MTDFISDELPTEPPMAAANEGYFAGETGGGAVTAVDIEANKNTRGTWHPGYRYINRGLGAFAGAIIGGGPTSYLGRAAERGTQADASAFDQGMAADVAQAGAFDQPLMAPAPQPVETPTLSVEDANNIYGPIGADGKRVPITDTPISEGLARIIGRQKSEAMEREGVIARFSEAHSLPVNLLAGTVASLADPINLGLTFLPPLGEGALAGRLATAGLTGLAGRALARVGAGAATGALTQLPIAGLEMGLAPEEASEVGLADAFRNVAYGAAGFAALHAVGGAVGDLLGRSEPVLPLTTALEPEDAARAIITAPADTNRAAMQSAVSQIADGRPVDAPVFYQPPMPDTALGGAVPLPSDFAADFAASQDRLYRDGFAAGVPADDFAATQDAVYGPKPEAAQPPAARAEPQEAPAAIGVAETPEQANAAPRQPGTEGQPEARPVDPEIAVAEQEFAAAPQEHLSAEDYALLAQSATDFEAAQDRAAAIETAAECLAGSHGL